MRLTIPFTYSAEVIIGRSRRPRRELFVEEVSVEVPELADEDAPIAMTVATQYNKGQRLPRDVYRYHNGRFLMYDLPNHPGVVSTRELAAAPGHPRADVLGKLFDLAWSQPSQRALGEWFRTPGYVGQRRPSADQVVEWLSSEREESLQSARAFAGGLVSMNGRLWFTVAEPKFLGMTGEIPYLAVDSRPFVKPGQPANPMSVLLFNINDGDNARKFLAGTPRAYTTFEWPTLEVQMPEVFVFDRYRHALEWAAGKVVEGLGSGIGEMPPDVVTTWMEARSALQNMSAGQERETTLANAVDALAPHVSSGQLRWLLGECLEMWNARPQESLAKSATGPAIR